MRVAVRCYREVGGVTAYYNENNVETAAWLRELIAEGLIAPGDVDDRSILDVEPSDLAGYTQCHFFAGIGGWSYAPRLAGWPDDVAVWTGSPPCQPFSTAGKRLGHGDERHLAPHFVELVRACRPGVLFGEQVASASVLGRVAKAAKRAVAAAIGFPEWAWWDDLSVRLEHSHYAVGASNIPAASVGAPHIRQRTFFGAVRLADADGGLACDGALQRGRQHGCEPQDGEAGRLVEGADPGGTDATDGVWRNPDWLLCRDGRWRPVEPGTFPLADGIPGRMGLLRGYDNAIVPQLGALFVEEFTKTFWEFSHDPDLPSPVNRKK